MNRSPVLGTVWSHRPQAVPAGQTAWSQSVPDQKIGDHCRPPDEVRGGVALSRPIHSTINRKTACKSKPDEREASL